MRLAAPIAGLFLFATLTYSLAPKNRARRSFRYRPYPIIFEPSHYDLEIKLDIPNDMYTGQVNITAECKEETNIITLNAEEQMKIQALHIQCRKQSPTDPTQQKFESIDVVKSDFVNEMWEIVMAQFLAKTDICLIHVKYSMKFDTYSTKGFLKDECRSSDKKFPLFMATNLREEDTKQWFPCFDSYQLRSTFELRVARPKNMVARSNTPIKRSVEMPGDPEYVMDHFEKTPEMSTSQLALMIADFESIAPTTQVDKIENQQLEIRVWGRKDIIASLGRVPNEIVRIINYLQKYFNKSIGLPKLDIVVRPMLSKNSDNWGLIFYRKRDFEKESLPIWEITHELIYQWIGQRITFTQWHEFYVMKALNSFLATKITEDLNTLNVREQTNEVEMKWPLNMLYSLYYAFGETRPFSRVIGIKDQALTIKTELVFRMLNYTLGEKVFREGMHQLLERYSVKLNSSTANQVKASGIFNDHNIYECMKSATKEMNVALPAGIQIENVMNTWIKRNRVPFVTVIRDYETGNVTLTQNTFLRDPPPPSNSYRNELSFKWDIPIVVRTQDKLNCRNYTPSTWLTEQGPRDVVMKDFAPPNKFVIINPEEIGTFPVNYDERNWKMLSEYLQGPNRETIPVLTRAKLLHDSWNLAYGGNLSFNVSLDMTLFMKKERNPILWEAMFSMIDHIGRKIQRLNVHKKFEAYTNSLLKPLYSELGETRQPDEPDWKTRMRGLVKNFLCQAGYEPCVAEARNEYRKWMNDDEPDEGNPVPFESLCPVFKWGTQEEFEFGIERAANFPDRSYRKAVEKPYLIKTLAGCPNDNNKIDRLLKVEMLSAKNFTLNDMHLLYTKLSSGSVGQVAFFQFIKDNWDKVEARFETDKRLWNNILNAALLFNDKEGYEMVKELSESRKGKNMDDDIVFGKALKTIEQAIKWNEQHLKVIDDWLTKYLAENPTDSQLTLSQNSSTTLDPRTVYSINASTTVTPIAG